MGWDAISLREALEQLRLFGDDRTMLECKRSFLRAPHDLARTICAFANMPMGGDILLGVDQSLNFAATGVAHPAQVEKAVADQARTLIEPAPQLSFTHISIDEAVVIAVTVAPLSPMLKPARIKGEAYLRQADGNYVMGPNDLRILEVAALHESEQEFYDQQTVPGSGLRDMDESITAEALRTARSRSRRLSTITDDKRLLEVLGATVNGQLTVAGNYALGFLPQGKVPALGVTAAVQLPREHAARTRNLTHFDGPLPALLDDVVDWLRANLQADLRYAESGHVEEIPEIPPAALREAVANALVHRDLGPHTRGVGKRIEVRITRQAVIITSPGGLRGVSVSQLTSTTLSKAAVNQRLYELAKLVRTSEGHPVIEGEGGGIREMIRACLDAGLAAPRLIDTGTEFRVIFPRTRPDSPHRVSARAAMRAVEASVEDELSQLGKNVPQVFHSMQLGAEADYAPALSLHEIAERTQLSTGQARYALKALERKGWIVMRGQRGSQRTTYQIRRE